ncbi:hypothetical protein J3Q64DRAFT_1825601 [Phycomyces blakesleeanus]|uniref:Uncharacterized protein n=1 Tax=Phycomyces blakesleeanus TaxID=4837 RepID=A0ABR3ALA0_PHYBL
MFSILLIVVRDIESLHQSGCLELKRGRREAVAIHKDQIIDSHSHKNKIDVILEHKKNQDITRPELWLRFISFLSVAIFSLYVEPRYSLYPMPKTQQYPPSKPKKTSSVPESIQFLKDSRYFLSVHSARRMSVYRRKGKGSL